MMIAAGVNAKALQAFMGHASITFTLDTYGHPMPGTEAEAAALVDSYLTAERERSEDAARGADQVSLGFPLGFGNYSMAEHRLFMRHRRPRMGGEVDLLDLLPREVRVELRRGDIRVAE